MDACSYKKVIGTPAPFSSYIDSDNNNQAAVDRLTKGLDKL